MGVSAANGSNSNNNNNPLTLFFFAILGGLWLDKAGLVWRLGILVCQLD